MSFFPFRLKHIFNDWRIALAILLVAVFAIYAQSLGHEFVYDDVPLIRDNQLIRSPSNIPAMFFQEDMLDDFSTGYYRPVIPVIDTMAFFVSGASPAWFHFLSIIYHLVATALVYLLARRVTGSSAGALYAAAFFSLHPVNSESVAFISAKNNAICSIFILGSVLCFLRYREGRGFFALAASAGLLFLGTLSKEFAGAEKAYARAIELDPSGVGPYMVLSELYEKSGLRDKALGLLRQAMENAPGESGPYNRAGVILSDMGMHADAVGYFRRALEIDPSCVECSYNLIQTEKLSPGGKGRN